MICFLSILLVLVDKYCKNDRLRLHMDIFTVRKISFKELIANCISNLINYIETTNSNRSSD